MSRSKAGTLIGLVSHFSPSGDERSAAEWLVTRMLSLGYEQAFVDPVGNAVGLMGHGPRQLVLLGHIDTVPGEIPVRVDEDVLHGRGAVDAKGPLACFVDAVAEVGALADWQLVVIGAVEEERDSEGARYAVDQYSPEYAIVGEPNRWDRIGLGYKGSAWAEITVKRPQAHTASGEQTACEAAVQTWAEIQAFGDAFNADKQRAFDKILPTLRGMQSGSDSFEQWARLSVGVRLPSDVSPSEWYAKLDAISGNGGVQRVGHPVPAWAGAKNSRLVRALLRAIRDHGGEPSFVYKTGTSDLNLVAPVWKCPAVVYGPGDSALDHTSQEQISLSEYCSAVDVLATAVRTLTASG